MIVINQGKYVITFEEKTHKYFVDNIEVPSVTTIMKNGGLDIYGHIDPIILRKASQRGTDVHKITELHDSGILNINKVDPIYLPYLTNWVNLLKKHEFEVLSCELILYSSKYNFIGTIDRIIEVKANNFGIPTGIYILDIKTGKLTPIARVQLYGYKMLYEEVFSTSGIGRIAAHVTNKEAKISLFYDEMDKYVFLSCLQIFQFKKKEGFLK
jgi:hypothetical protein